MVVVCDYDRDGDHDDSDGDHDRDGRDLPKQRENKKQMKVK